MSNSKKLTEREKEVLYLVAEGLTNWEISKTLTISEHTVKEHRKKINQKLGTNNPIRMLVAARAKGLI